MSDYLLYLRFTNRTKIKKHEGGGQDIGKTLVLGRCEEKLYD